MSEKIEAGQLLLPRLTEDRNKRERIETTEILASGLIGGLFISLATALLLLLNGLISGISGIVSGLLAPKSSDVGRRVVFVAALFSAPWVTCWSRAAR